MIIQVNVRSSTDITTPVILYETPTITNSLNYGSIVIPIRANYFQLYFERWAIKKLLTGYVRHRSHSVAAWRSQFLTDSHQIWHVVQSGHG